MISPSHIELCSQSSSRSVLTARWLPWSSEKKDVQGSFSCCLARSLSRLVFNGCNGRFGQRRVSLRRSRLVLNQWLGSRRLDFRSEVVASTLGLVDEVATLLRGIIITSPMSSMKSQPSDPGHATNTERRVLPSSLTGIV